MANSTFEPRCWEIWMAIVRFEEDPEKIKERPVMICPDGAVFISYPITSHDIRENDPLDYPISKWKEAGLHHQSTLRLGKRIRLEKSHLLRRLGALAIEDVYFIHRALKKCAQQNRRI